jgi:hypothetical protein
VQLFSTSAQGKMSARLGEVLEPKLKHGLYLILAWVPGLSRTWYKKSLNDGPAGFSTSMGLVKWAILETEVKKLRRARVR